MTLLLIPRPASTTRKPLIVEQPSDREHQEDHDAAADYSRAPEHHEEDHDAAMDYSPAGELHGKTMLLLLITPRLVNTITENIMMLRLITPRIVNIMRKSC